MIVINTIIIAVITYEPCLINVVLRVFVVTLVLNIISLFDFENRELVSILILILAVLTFLSYCLFIE